MTFSLVARSADGSQLGVAVASKFLAVGAFVPAVALGAGALATQAHVNLALKRRGIDALARGTGAQEVLDAFFADDPGRDHRQAGVVDARGGVATFTGGLAMDWAGGRTGSGPGGAYAAQGNVLAGPQVVDALVDSWTGSGAGASMPRRLLAALRAGQAAGGDRRGQQSAALVVLAPGAGYGGGDDVLVDLRSDDSPAPLDDLERMLGQHELFFGRTPESELLTWDDALRGEVRERLGLTGRSASGGGAAVEAALEAWMGRENLEERWREGRLDPVVLAHLRTTTS